MLFGVVGLFFGYWIQQFSQTVYILGAGLAFAAIVSRKILREKFQHFQCSLHFHIFCSWLFLHGRCTDKNPWIGKNQDPKANLKIRNPRRKSSTFSFYFVKKILNFVSHFQYTVWRKFRQIRFSQGNPRFFLQIIVPFTQCRNVRTICGSEFTWNRFCKF